MKRPFNLLALLYAGGIVTAEYVHFPVWIFLCCSMLLLGIAVGLEKFRVPSLMAVLFLTGWTNAIVQSALISPNDLRQHFDEMPHLVSVRGTLIESPRIKLSEGDDGETSSRSIALVRATSFRRKEAWEPAHGDIQVTTYGPLQAEFRKGEEVEISGVIQPPPAPIAEGLFDYRTFLRRQGIYFQLSARNEKDWQMVSTPSSAGIPEQFLNWAQYTLKRGLPEEDQSLHLLYAMTLGWKTALDPETSQTFMRSGTMHIFAISGLHIALIAGMLIALMRAARVPRKWCGWIAIPILWFYTAATGWQPSAVRSSIMMTIVIVGWSLKRPSDLVNSLAAAAFIILLWQPSQLFQASFQLSFFVVLSIALLMPPFEKLRQNLLQHDPLLPAELRPAWHRWLDLPIRFVSISFITSVAAWLGSLPISAHYFHLLTPVSLLANLAVVPISSLALMGNLGSLLVVNFCPFFAELFNHASWFFMTSMVWLSDRATELPGAYMNVRTPSFVEFLLFYSVVFSLCTGWIFKTRHKKWALSAMGILSICWVAGYLAEQQTWKITILPLGGGDSIFVDAPRKQDDLLIDCGDARSAGFLVQPYLEAQGVNHLPNMLLSHGDVRHVGGANSVLAAFSFDRVFTSPMRFRSIPYRTLLAELDATPELRSEVAQDATLAGWQVLHPAKGDRFSQADDGPLVLKKTIHGKTFLFLSDLGRIGQDLLMERYPELRTDIVVSGLPRDGEAVCNALIELLKPKLIIITDAEFPATDRASPKLRERLHSSGIPVVFTRDSGAVTFELKKSGMQVRAISGTALSTKALQGIGRQN